MAQMYERGNSRIREYAEEQKHRRNTGVCVFVVLLILAIAAVCVYLYFERKNETVFEGWETREMSETIAELGNVRTKNGLIVYNRDGAICYGKDAEVVWQTVYSMREPKAAAAGEYTVIGDIGATTVAITDSTGDLHSYSVPGRIRMVDVAENGTAAVLVDLNEQDHIYLIDMDGTVMLDIDTSVKKAGFPISIKLSPDGKKLVTSYLQVGEEQKTSLTFYNFGEVGQNYTDKIVGSYFYNGIVPDIRFIGNNNVAAVSKGGCMFYSFREIPESIGNVNPEGGLMSLCSDDKNIVLVSRHSDNDRTFGVYGADGKLVSSFDSGFEYSGLYISEGEIILTADRSCVIFRTDGSEKLRTRLDERICALVPQNDITTYILKYPDTVGVLKLKTAKDIKKEKEAEEKKALEEKAGNAIE